ncbi:MAG: hypothetical protein ACRDAU_11625 [Clostridium sp.]
MENFINVKAKIVEKKNLDSKTISLVYEIINISNNIYKNLYFNFNIKEYGKVKKIVLEKNKKYTSYTSKKIYISSIGGREKMYIGIILILDNDNEKIFPIELSIKFTDYLGRNHKRRVVKYLKNEDGYERVREEIFFLYTNKKYANYREIIRYKIVLINNIYNEIKNIVVPINIPKNTKYIKNSLVIDGIKKIENIKSIQVKSLKRSECICIEYSVEINSVFINGNIINNMSIIFENDEGKCRKVDKTIVTRVKDSRIKIVDIFEEVERSKQKDS